jgi:hypothetical protein
VYLNRHLIDVELKPNLVKAVQAEILPSLLHGRLDEPTDLSDASTLDTFLDFGYTPPNLWDPDLVSTVSGNVAVTVSSVRVSHIKKWRCPK